MPVIKHLLATFALCTSVLGAQTTFTITPDTKAPGIVIPERFSGFSFETQLLLPIDGVHYFRPDNLPLINLFHTLGIKNLRIGGNTVDNPAVAIPNHDDIDSLFQFAKAADVNVVYSLRLKGTTDAAANIEIVKYITDRFATSIDCFALGNEPNYFLLKYPDYLKTWNAMTSQIISIVPGTKFCGPNTDRHYEWAAHFADDLGSSGKLKAISEHAYVGLSARKVTDVAAARDQMLSDKWTKLYQDVYDGFVPQAINAHLSYRIEETNTFFNGGKEGASDTFTAALWGVDYMYWWASHGAAGINFHTGDKVAAGAESTPCRYAAYLSVPAGYAVRPVGYAIKMFDLGGHGRLIPIEIEPADSTIAAYAMIDGDRDLSVTLINKSHGTGGHVVNATVNVGKAFTSGKSIVMSNASHDIASKDDITIGEAPINDDASWNGKWSEVSPSADGFSISVPAATAVVVKLH